MLRMAVITVGKTHSGKTTFTRALENELGNSFVMDQDNNAEFLPSNTKITKITEWRGAQWRKKPWKFSMSVKKLEGRKSLPI